MAQEPFRLAKVDLVASLSHRLTATGAEGVDRVASRLSP
jgi:hypothetical protein